jgi:energy-coupling factor transport system ATP-binding protein
MQAPQIVFKDFSFTYQGQTEPTLKHIDLTIREGEKVLIVGPSGSGKSTLGYCINALIPHAFRGVIEGTASICSMNLEDGDIYAVNKKVGTVLQDTDAQFVGLTVAEDIAFSLENQCMERKKMENLVSKMAGIVGMQEFLKQSPQEISGGQKQRVSLAGVLVDDVEVLLFDEPLANLDPATGLKAMGLIDQLPRETGKTVLIIEHRLEDVLSYPVDRILVMQEGSLVADTTPQVLLGTALLSELGLRDPLYLAALRMAGCDFSTLGDVSSLDTIHLRGCMDRVKAWHQKEQRPIDVQEKPVQLELEHISYSFDGLKTVLDDVSATIHEGEMVSILGNNGAGKSTLAQILMGVIRQDSGHIRYEGTLLDAYSASQRSSRIGFVMQNPNHMISCDLVYDEVAFALRQQGYGEEQIKDRVMDVLGLCALRPYHHWPISALSYGQKKRVTIASILVTNPKLLILDEPTSGQDYQRYTALMEFLSELNRKTGLTILFITHDMHLALEYTHRSLVLHDGHLLCDKPTSDVLADDEVLHKANLKETSLSLLAKRCGISDVSSFIDTFVRAEQQTRSRATKVSQIPALEKPLSAMKPRRKRVERAKKEGRKFGFALTYEETDSPLHQLNGVTKFILFLTWIVFCLTTFDIRFLMVSTIISFSLLSLTRIPLRKFSPYIMGMLTVIALNAMFIYLFSPDQGTRYLGSRTIILGPEHARYSLSAETLFYLVVVCLKYFSIFPMALLFVSITHPSQFASSLNRLGISYRISYAVALALRYLPEVTKSYMHILHAQMARGVDFSSQTPLKKRLSSVGRVITPLVFSSLDRIDVITNAMVLRGFARSKSRTWYMQRKLKSVDFVVMALIMALLAASLYSRFIGKVMFWYPF